MGLEVIVGGNTVSGPMRATAPLNNETNRLPDESKTMALHGDDRFVLQTRLPSMSQRENTPLESDKWTPSQTSFPTVHPFMFLLQTIVKSPALRLVRAAFSTL